MVRVAEHQIVPRRCACCDTSNSGAGPEEVAAPVQYGPRIAAIILYMYVGRATVRIAPRQPVRGMVRGMKLRLLESLSAPRVTPNVV
jgi:hypothetical protein